jgi:glycosyltransferase involved in cell wall biosynthesis
VTSPAADASRGTRLEEPDENLIGDDPWPLVTIGIPTFNRASGLSRAVDSCRRQSYPHLEIVISDNASTDATPHLCDEWSRADARIIVIRQAQNIGRERNFRAALHGGSGLYFMWLSDDDWLDRDYVSRCAERLASEQDCVLAGGVARYYFSDGHTRDDTATSLVSPDPARRVESYLAAVSLSPNGTYYGLMRRGHLDRAEYPITLAGDWYFVAQMAALGTVARLSSVVIHRSSGGDSDNLSELAASYGLDPRWGHDVHLWALLLLVPSLVAGRGTFRAIPPARRVASAARIAFMLAGRWWLFSGHARTRRVARAGRGLVLDAWREVSAR